MAVGLDNVIEIMESAKNNPAIKPENYSKDYENTLAELRGERGKAIAKQLDSYRTKEEKEQFLRTLNAYELEDCARYKDLSKMIESGNNTAHKILGDV